LLIHRTCCRSESREKNIPTVSKPKDKDKETNSLILWTSLGLIAGGIAFFLWYNSNSHRLNGDSVPIIDSVQLNKASNSDSAAIAKANAQLSEELGIDTNSSDASTPSSTTSVPDSKKSQVPQQKAFNLQKKVHQRALLPKVVLEVNEF
jgi:hypothetical protein